MAATVNGESQEASPMVSDWRNLIPATGLKEYWHPAVRDKDVKANKPQFLKMLGEDICLFRGKSGNVAALANSCPHRGAKLCAGDIMFKGFVPCHYHAWTWDENGECVAILSEGPESPHVGRVHARVYPTATLKGVVFVWMGKGEPVPLEQSIPEEFFEEDTLVFNWPTVWPCNWRPGLENVADSHFRYVHRNSALCLMRPIAPPSPGGARAQIMNKHRLRPPAAVAGDRDAADRPYQDYYPGVDAKWPKTKYRMLWTWIFDWSFKRKWRKPFKVSEEWGGGSHLPGFVRLNYGTHMYTRWAVPIDENNTRFFYFHSARPETKLGKLYEWAHWNLFHNWAMNRNFSEQDRKGALEAYWPAPEHLSLTDAQTIMWRRMLLTARGVRPEREGDTSIAAARAEVAAAEEAHAKATDALGTVSWR